MNRYWQTIMIGIFSLIITSQVVARRDFSFPGPQEKALEQEMNQFRGQDRDKQMEVYAKKRCLSRKPAEGDSYNWQEDPLDVCQFFNSFDEADSEVPNDEESLPPRKEQSSSSTRQLNRSVPQKRSDPRRLNKSIPG